MPTFATITGRITIPGADIGIRAEVTATPLTTDNVVIDTDRANWGPATAETKSDGTLTGLKIPLGVAPVGVLWRIAAKPLDKRASLQPWTVGIFEITGSTTLQALALNGVAVTAVTETMVTDVTALVAEAEESAADAENYASIAGSLSGIWTVDPTDPDVLIVTPNGQVSVDPVDPDVLNVVV